MSSPLAKKLLFQGGLFSIITKDKETQNDRERILKKLNLSSNKPENSNKQTPLKKYPPSKIPLSKKNAHNSRKSTPTTKSHLFQIEANPPYYNLPKSKHLFPSNSFTHPHTKNTNGLLPTTNQKNNKSASLLNYSDKKSGNNRLASMNNSLYSNEIKIIKDDKMSSFSLFDEDENEKDSKNTSNGAINNNDNFDNNFFCPRINKLNIKLQKMQKLFIYTPDYNMSNRIVNDELKNERIMHFNTEYKFINNIRESSNNIERMSLKSFLKLSDYSLFYLMSFLFESYNTFIFKSNKYIFSKVNFCFNTIFHDAIEKFSSTYENILQLDTFNFIQKTFSYHKKNSPLLNLVLHARIISKEINTCYAIGYHYIYNKKEMEIIWKFDVRKRSKLSLWVSSECEVFNEYINCFCYSQPILSFCAGDVIVLHVNVFSLNGAINPFSIRWLPPKAEPAPRGFFQKSMIRSPYEFDKLRACEVENMIHFWRTEENFIRKNMLINEFMSVFKRHFKIESVFYDGEKVILFKVFLKAVSVGIVKRNKFANFDFEIVPFDRKVNNEIQSIFELNANSFMGRFQIRKGTIVLFYIIQNYCK